MSHQTPSSNRFLQNIQLSDDSQFCLAAAVACLLAGVCGWLVNLFAPASTSLDALLVVGCFYLLIGIQSALSTAPKRFRIYTFRGDRVEKWSVAQL